MTAYLRSADATKTALDRTSRSRGSNALRADSLIRLLREDLAKRSADESGQSSPRVYGYGLAQVATTRVFREITSDGHLHIVDAISGDEIDGIHAFVVNDAYVWPGNFPGQLRPDGTIFSGRFSGTGRDGNGPTIGSRIRFKRGSAGQTIDADLISRTSLDSSFVGTGIAYVYSEFVFIDGLFQGDPSMEVITRLRRAVDPRTGTAGWSFNPYVHLYDILTKGVDIGGAGVDASLIDEDSFNAACTWADMAVETTPVTKTALLTTESNTGVANHVLEFDSATAPFSYGDVVQVVAASGQSMPPGFGPGVDYHVIPIRHAVSDFQVPGVALAATLQDALAGNYIAAGTRLSEIDLKKVKEIRFVSGLSYTSNEAPLSVIRRMLESCGAALYVDDGKIAVTRNVFPSTVEAVSESEILGQVAVSNALPADERATELTGVYTSLLNLLEPDDYPKVDGGGVYEALDGQRIPARHELPLVGKAGAAQRLATIALRRLRQERTVAFSGSLGLYRLKPGTIFALDKPSLGLDAATTFEVRDQSIFVEIIDGLPFVGVDIVGRQLEAATFDLASDDEQLVEEARIPGLNSPFDPNPPGVPQIAESLFVTTNGAGVKAKVTVSWTAAPGGFARGYLVAYRLTGESTFRRLPETPDLSVEITDIAPGTYLFQVQTVNTLGLRSEPATKTQQIQALSAPPSAPSGFTGQVVGSASVLLAWEQSGDLDVRFGGQVEIRHHSDPDGSLGDDSILLGYQDGNSALAQLPFKRGTYYLRFLDQGGRASDFAEFSFDSRRPAPFAQVISSGSFVANDATEDQITIQEDPSFPSTNPNNTMVEDTGNQWLELGPAESVDDVTDMDAVADMDAIGGDGTVAPEGVYFFSTGIALSAVTRMLIETVLETQVVDESTSVDNISDMDVVVDMDAVGANASQPGLADAWFECRTTRDDPTGSPTWTDWRRIDTDVLNHRGVEFRVQARSYAETVNIRITQARVLARELPVDF